MKEFLTDPEQRIFLSAMENERKICRDVDYRYPGNISLVKIVDEIERKVKKEMFR